MLITVNPTDINGNAVQIGSLVRPLDGEDVLQIVSIIISADQNFERVLTKGGNTELWTPLSCRFKLSNGECYYCWDVERVWK